jgi:hypothetical protein
MSIKIVDLFYNFHKMNRIKDAICSVTKVHDLVDNLNEF